MIDKRAILHIRLMLACLATASMTVATAKGQTQSPMLLGVGAGAALPLGSQSVSIPVYAPSGDCGTFTSGRTTLQEINGWLELPSLLSSSFGVSFLLGWEHSQADFTAPVDTLYLPNPDGGGTATVLQEPRLSVTAGRLRIGGLASYKLTDQLTLSGGPVFGYQIQQSRSQTLVRLGNFRFPNGSDQAADTNGIPFTSRPISFSLDLGLSGSIPLGKRISATAYITLQSDFLSPVAEASWQRLTINGGGMLFYDLAPAAEPAIAENLPPPLSPSGKTEDRPAVTDQPSAVLQAREHHALKADVDLYAVNEQGLHLPMATVHVYEVLRRVTTIPLSTTSTEPTTNENLERDFDPPLLKIVPRISADAGVKGWTIVLKHDSMVIARYTNQQNGGHNEDRINWQIGSEPQAPAQSTLVAEMTVEDSLGSTATGHGRTPLTIERSQRVVDKISDRNSGKESIAYTLFPQEPDMTEPSSRNAKVLEEIAQNVRSGARISISTGADRMQGHGNPPDTREEQVATALRGLLGRRKAQNVTIALSNKGTESHHIDSHQGGDGESSRAIEIIVDQKAPSTR